MSKMNDPDLAILGECSDALIKIYKSRQITGEEIRKIESLIDAELNNGPKDYDKDYIRKHVEKLTA